jgi:hypothetical protein
MTHIIESLGRMAADAQERAELAVERGRDAEADALFSVQERADDLLVALARWHGVVGDDL